MLGDVIIHGSDVGVDVPGRDDLLHGLNITVRSQDRIAIMGPSGSGKSTLLAALGGLIEPNRGRVVRPGISTEFDLAWVFQQTYVLGFRTVLDNVALAGLAFGLTMAEAQKQAVRACQAVDLSRQITTLAGSISGGERQRIGVARALIGSRRIILADEPTANLDSELVLSISKTLLQSSSVAAVVIATHDQRVAELCQSIYHLEGGKIAATQ